MARVAAPLFCLGLVVASEPLAQAAQPTILDAQLIVDSDDDDGDGVADSAAPARDCVDCAIYELSKLPPGLVLRAVSPQGAARVLVEGAVVELGRALPASARSIAVQALLPGTSTIDLGAVQVRVRAIQLIAVDGAGRPVDLATAHASLQRTVPDRVDDVAAITNDPDALRYVFKGQAEDLPAAVRVLSRSERGDTIQLLAEMRTVPGSCPGTQPQGMVCRSTAPLRVVGDDIDRRHPLVVDRSIRGELGGAVMIDAGAGRRQQIRIGGPRQTKLGPLRRYRASLRTRLMRIVPRGAPPLGGRDDRAIAMVREQIAIANALWGQCGISFGAPEEADIALVDPPNATMIGVGCDLGTPAAGGELRLRVEGRALTLKVTAGSTPAQVARRLQQELTKQGFGVAVSPNARISPGALPTVDLLVRRRDGAAATVTGPPQGAVSTDPTLGVCLGRADLSAGMHHFYDADSMAGTFEERLLLKSVEDRDPSTIDLLIISAFARGGRIGESFIGNDRSSLRNMVVVDRAGIRVARASFTLAHEAGHVLLDIPGHPDDYGYDTPTLLMDSDGADLTAFGPRRLTVAECERVVEQSGPQTAVPLLRLWPWGKLQKTKE